MMRLFGTMLLLACAGATWAAGPPDVAAWARFGKIEEARRLNLRGFAMYQAAKFADATAAFEKVLEMRESLYPRDRYSQGHADLSQSLNNLAFLYKLRGEYAKAAPLYARALAIEERLHPKAQYPQGHPDLTRSLNNLAMLYMAQSEYAKAEPLLARALAMEEALHPKAQDPLGHPDLTRGLNNLAQLHQARGDYAKAEPLLARALAMEEGLHPKTRDPQGHLNLARSLNNLAMLHKSRGDFAKAEPLLRRASEMYEGLYPTDRYPQRHTNVARSLNNLALLHQEQGDYSKAEPLFARALAIEEGLHPKIRDPLGHPDLARVLNNLAYMHYSRGDYAKAEPLYVRALEMRERLYPRARYPWGHPDLAISLNALGLLHNSRGDYAKAEPLHRRALGMYEGLYPTDRYPQGHPDLARSLINLANLHQAQGEYAKAEPLATRAVEMRQGLYPRARYPKGHPHLAHSLNSLASVYLARGDHAKAGPLYARALKMYNDSTTSLAAVSSEATALNYAAQQPLTRDGYLFATTHLPKVDVYPAVWQTKAALARVSERRHLAVLAASSDESRLLWDAVLSLKRERERLLLAPADAAKAKARDNRLDEIEDLIRKKEDNLRPLLPAMKRSDDLAKRTPAELRKALPADVAFVDLLRYNRLRRDPKMPGKKGRKYTAHYVAFVLARASIIRVELGAAEPIEDALALWRVALTEGRPSEPKYAARVHTLLWSPLVKHLPAKASTVFVSPDAALNGVPWAALRDAKTRRILLEEYTVATIPHGPMLLDRFTEEKRKREIEPTLLAMGGVAYDKEPRASSELAMRGPVGDALTWPALGGTAKELRQLVALAGERRVIRREGDAAGAMALLADLPKAETAHLATHGFFADPKFRTVFQLDPKLFDRMGSERNTAGTRSPMVLSGLVCAGANVKGTPNRGVVTADAIVGLDLRKLNLAVLSACETGLGDVAGGEGVYGLVRAFHVAGTRNVVASLWKVDDEATAALMVLFYRNLWGKEKVSPREALRRAQLAVYREPGRVPEWAAGRGPLPTPVEGGETKPPEKGPKGKTSPARAWAAFVISGPGD